MVPVAPAESLSVETAGRGAPVVLIPGLFGSAFGFRKLVPLLVGAGYRTIVIEPLGVGASARPEKANYSLTAQADRIAAVLDSLHVRNALVLAHSIGGSEAFRLSYRRPDLVRGLLSIEGGPTERAITPAFKRALRFAPWIKLFGGIRLIRRKIRGMLIDSSGDPSWVTDSTVLGYTAAAGRNLDATLKAYLAMANAREPELLAPHLSQTRCPGRRLVGAPAAGDHPPGARDRVGARRGALHTRRRAGRRPGKPCPPRDERDRGSRRRVTVTEVHPMRIALVAEDYYPQLGGVPEHVHNLALQLNSWGHPTTVVTSNMGDYPDAPFVRRVGTSRVIYSNGGVSRVTTGWRLRRRLEAVFRAGRYDIVHVHGGHARYATVRIDHPA